MAERFAQIRPYVGRSSSMKWTVERQDGVNESYEFQWMARWRCSKLNRWHQKDQRRKAREEARRGADDQPGGSDTAV